MRPLDFSRTAFALIVALAVGACSKDDAPSTNPPDTPKQTQEKKAQVEPVQETAKVAKPVTAPFTVELVAPEKVPTRGVVELTAVINVAKAFEGKSSISVELPEGVKLIGGEAKEEFTELPAGKTERTFKVNFTKAPDPENPVKVIVEGQDAAGTFGARAERKFPEKTE